MKRNLLAIVQDILSDMDSEEVNSISDSVEAEQVARIVRSTYESFVATLDIPEHRELIKLEAASDSDYPTHFSYTDDVKEIVELWYENSQGFYHKLKWVDPLDFLTKTDTVQSDFEYVYDKHAGTKLRIKNNATPDFYTSFDDQYIVCNSYDSEVDDTLQESKIRAYGTVYPTFTISDDFVPDLDSTMFPYLIAESKSVAMSLLKGGTDAKIDQMARRQKQYRQNDMYKTKRANARPNYGRR